MEPEGQQSCEVLEIEFEPCSGCNEVQIQKGIGLCMKCEGEYIQGLVDYNQTLQCPKCLGRVPCSTHDLRWK